MPSEEYYLKMLEDYEEELEQELEEEEEKSKAENEEEPARKKKFRPYTVLFMDEQLLVLNKAAGIATIPERGTDESLKTLSQKEFGRNWTVHRIDKETSGVVLFARTAQAHQDLSEQFRTRKVKKRYLTVVEGEMPQEELEIDIPLATDPGKAGRIRPSANGKEAFTRLKVVEQFQGYTLVEAIPETGRQHQIRVHCQAVGLPLLVDRLYSQHDAFYLSTIKRKFRDYGREERPLIDRVTLHAESLTARHPGTGEDITFTAELPKDFRALLTQLRKLRGV